MREILPPTLIEKLLNGQIVGRMGCSADGTTYVVPVTYAYDGDNIYVHSAKGMKTEMMQKNPEVCFQVDDIQNLVNWRSVIVWGRFEEIHGEERKKAITLLVDRILAQLADDEGLPAHGAIAHANAAKNDDAIWYRIKITRKTGRFEAD